MKELSIDLETYSDVDIKKPEYIDTSNLTILKFYYLQYP